MTYVENPKTRGSGIVCCIPQTGRCPNGCADCFFQSGRSYLEPLAEHLPNLPPLEMTVSRVVRVNDGNDSNVRRELVISSTSQYEHRFFNTAIPADLGSFPGPVVLTANPGKMTDDDFHRVCPAPPNLMFVSMRTNTWNLGLVEEVVAYYSAQQVPIVLTFMAYFEETVPSGHQANYVFRKRTLNSYWAITTKAWEMVMAPYRLSRWVYSCGKVEGEEGVSGCRYCGNCLREYFAAKERLRQATT